MSNFTPHFAITDTEFWVRSLVIAGSVISLYVIALWVAMTFWIYRDAKSRYRGWIAPTAAASVAGIFNLPGLLLYLAVRPQEPLLEAYNRQLEAEAFRGEILKRDVCPQCSAATSEAFVACPYCKALLQEPCAECGRNLQSAWTLCPYCRWERTVATPQGVAAAVAMPADGAPRTANVPPLQRSPLPGLALSMNGQTNKEPARAS